MPRRSQTKTRQEKARRAAAIKKRSGKAKVAATRAKGEKADAKAGRKRISINAAERAKARVQAPVEADRKPVSKSPKAKVAANPAAKKAAPAASKKTKETPKKKRDLKAERDAVDKKLKTKAKVKKAPAKAKASTKKKPFRHNFAKAVFEGS